MLEEAFPQGIEILLMERSISTPEQRFGPNWFLPALSRYKNVLIQVLIASSLCNCSAWRTRC